MEDRPIADGNGVCRALTERVQGDLATSGVGGTPLSVVHKTAVRPSCTCSTERVGLNKR
jgi:hypothetical protein